MPKISTLKAWSARHQWVMRCGEWGAHLQRLKDRAAGDYAVRSEVRRLEAMEEAWSLGDVLMERFTKMAAMPLTTTKTARDGKTILVIPAKWNYQTMTLMAKTICELRAAVLAATNRPVSELSEVELLAMQRAREKFLSGKIAEDDQGLT